VSAGLEQALAATAARVVALAPRRWTLALPACAAPVVARADDAWLWLERTIAVEPAAALLARNATTTGGARIVLAPAPRVRVDIALDGVVDLPRRLVEACAGLALAPAAPPAPVADDAFVMRCRETGWPVDEREPGTVIVPLDVPDDVHVAQAVRCDDGGALVAIDVAGEPESDPGREAMGRLLLRTAAAVRMVRAAPPARFEVVFASMPSADELAHAFAASSVACRLAAREAAVLERDDALARAYVAHSEGGQ
jgi:hypothetical protein